MTQIQEPELLRAEGFREFCKGNENPWPPGSEEYSIYRDGWLDAYDRWRKALDHSAYAMGRAFARQELSVKLNPFQFGEMGHRCFRNGFADEINSEPTIVAPVAPWYKRLLSYLQG